MIFIFTVLYGHIDDSETVSPQIETGESPDRRGWRNVRRDVSAVG